MEDTNTYYHRSLSSRISSTELLQDMQNLRLQGTIVRTARQALPTADAALIDP
jgi:hypothetical protein